MNMLDITPAVVRDTTQDALDHTAEQGSNATIQGASDADAALKAGASLLQGETFAALRSAINAQRAQVKDAETSAHYFVNTDDGAQLNSITSSLEARVKSREDAYNQAVAAAVEDLLANSAPVIDQRTPSAKVASMAGLLRDALRMNASPEALVKEAIVRNDAIALHHLLGDSLWPLYAARGTDIRALRVSAAQQRLAAGQSFPGSQLYAFLTGGGASLGAQARDASVARWNATKRAATIARKKKAQGR
jgi:hypothetical protein